MDHGTHGVYKLGHGPHVNRPPFGMMLGLRVCRPKLRREMFCSMRTMTWYEKRAKGSESDPKHLWIG